MDQTAASGKTLGARVLDHLRHPLRRPHGLRLLIAACLLLLSAIPVQRDQLSHTESLIFKWLNQMPSWLEPVLGPVMQLGNLVAVFVVAAIALVVTRRRRIALDLTLAGGVAWLAALGLKAAFARGRPAAFLHEVIIRGTPGTGYGFVSGHAAVAAALATVAAAYLGTRGKVVVACLAAAVAVARVYVGAHLPLDVLGGAALGWAIGSLVHFVVLPEVLQHQRIRARR